MERETISYQLPWFNECNLHSKKLQGGLYSYWVLFDDDDDNNNSRQSDNLTEFQVIIGKS